jgi:hypothetical protein
MAEAARVRLGVSQENTEISFALIATRLVTITGNVLNSEGQPAIGGVVTLASGGAAGRGMFQLGGNGRIDQNGSFRLPNVAPGSYELQARTAGRDGQFARLPVTVGGADIEGLTVVTRPGARVTGSIVTDTGEPPDFRPQQLQVSARAVSADFQLGGGAGGGARVNDDWTFELNSVSEARLIRVSAPQGWTLKAVNANGTDITDTPAEFPSGQTVSGVTIVLSKQVTTLSGLVADSRSRPILDATVVVFPEDEQLWTFQSRFVRTARPDQEGRYRITALPASEHYLVIAVQGLEEGQAGDPEFLASIKDAAARFALNDGENKSVDVKFAPQK